ncbi:MAG: HDOD domain-containing protein [Desulfovibrionales bacterium]|nr:MAG: HDOD domain-containing protein [Desulfovibrionales bacterium]
MALCSIDDLQPGMVLTSDLRTKHGRLLLSAGACLTEEHLKIARIWGIAEAEVHPGPTPSANQDILCDIDPESRGALEALIEWRFAWCDHELPITKMLVALFQRRICADWNSKAVHDLLACCWGSPPLKVVPAFRGEDETPKLSQIVSREVDLVTLPGIFHELLEAVVSPTSSSAQIAEIISKDTSLSSRLLRLVNSSFFGFISRVDTLSRAVTIIGTVEITNLAMGISVTSMFDNVPKDIIDVHDFWEHSIAVGVLARILAAQMNQTKLERIFVAGLLHDVGRLVLIKNYPALTASMIRRSWSSSLPLHQIEQSTLGFSHAELGGALLKAWNIPQSLQDAVRYHHEPGLEACSKAVVLVHIANAIAHAVGFGHSGSRRVTPVAATAWEQTGLSLNVLPTVITQAQNQLRDLMRVILQEQSDAA